MDVTALSITPEDESARGVVEADQEGTYRLLVQVDQQVLADETAELRAGEDLTLTVTAPADGATLTAELFRSPATEAVRRVTLVGAS